MIHNNQSLLYVSYSWNFRHRLVRLYWYLSPIYVYIYTYYIHVYIERPAGTLESVYRNIRVQWVKDIIWRKTIGMKRLDPYDSVKLIIQVDESQMTGADNRHAKWW